MPSVVLNQESPFSVLYLERTPFSLTPRVFGCVAFVHVLDPGHDKLSPRSPKCIFLGYSRTQKGYRCYSPESRRCFVSADVTFFESTSFFSSPGQCLSPDLISSHEGEGSFSSPTLPIPLLSPPQVPQLTLLCRFISDPKIGVLYLIAPILHLLCQRFLLPHPLFLRLMIYLLLYDEVNVLVLNTQLLIFCLIIVFHLVYILLLVLCPLSLFIPLISRLYLCLDGNMLWMRK